MNRTRVHDNTTTGLAATFGGGIDNIVGLVSLTDCEIANNVVSSQLGAFGGGVSSIMGATRLLRCSVHGNVTKSATVVCSGGAIFSAASLLDAENSTLNNNSAVAIYRSRGGAIHSTAGAYATLTLCTLDGNSSGGGGAIQNDFLATLTMTNCTMSSNSVSGIIGANGGAVGNDDGGTVTLVGCTLDHNVATGFSRGGGIYNHCSYESFAAPGIDDQQITLIQHTTATLINCTLSSNLVAGTQFTIPNPSSLLECLLQNQVLPGSCQISQLPTIGFPLPGQGGGAYNGSESDSAVAVGPLAKPAFAELDLLSCTVVGNSATGGTLYTDSEGPNLATDGGGLYTTDASALDPERWGYSINHLDNTLLVKNQLNSAPSDFRPVDLYPGPTPVLMVINNSGPNLDSDGSLAAAKKIGTSSVYTQSNPLLGPLADNGGPTLTHALLSGSLALLNGSANAPVTDQRGVLRAQNGSADIGAFEASPPRPDPDSYTSLEDHPLQVGAAEGVLSNDFGAGLTASLYSQATNGVVVLAADGSFVYTPTNGYVGADSFFYSCQDGAGLSGGPTLVSIQVNPVLQLLSSSGSIGGTNASRNQFSLAFDVPVNPSSLASGIIVRGSESVVQPVTTTVSNTVVRIKPTVSFHPGELVTVEMLRSLVATNGGIFPVAKTIQYLTPVDAGSGQFPTYSSLSSNYVATVVLADFDGNGTIDAYVGGDLYDEIWLNDGHGNFTLSQTMLGNTTGAAVSDLNGDGFPDLVVTKAGGVLGSLPANVLNPEYPSDYNRVYFNDGTGHFADSGQELVPDTFVDPDSAPDPNLFLPITTSYFYGYGVYESTFTPNITDFYHYLNDGSAGVAIGDLNGDGYPDMFIINNTSKSSLGHPVSTPGNTVWLNNGHGSFSRSGPKLGNEPANAVVLADVDGNGTLDAIVAADDGTEIWLNDGNGNFTQSTTLKVSDYRAISVAVGDVNGDGSMDMVIGHIRPWFDSAQPLFGDEVFTNDGHGNFLANQFFGNIAAYGVALGDLNGDGRLDVFATGLVGDEVWLSTGTNFVKSGPTFGTEHWGRTVALADLDGDGDLDAFVGNFGLSRDSCQVWFNDVRPAANNFNFSVPEEGFLSVPAFGVLSGASDSDGPALLVQTNAVKTYTAPTLGALIYLVSGLPNFSAKNFSYDSQGNNIYLQTVPVYANHGTLNLRPDGSFTYTPQPLFHGTDSFPFVVSDSYLSTTNRVTIDVTPINHAPVAKNDYYPLSANPLTIPSANGVLANDSDPDGDAITASLAQAPAHGVVVLQADGSFTYTAAAGYTGPDSFLYRVSDGQTNSIGRVKLGNSPPVARDDLNYAMPANGNLFVAAPTGVLANDSDPDGDVISAALVTPPAHGKVTLNADGSYSYARATNYSGADFFTYRASDGIGNSSAARVKIGNTAPTGVNDGPYTAFLNQTLTVSAAQGVLANDQDAEGDKITAHLLAAPANGVVTLNPDGSFTYTPHTGFSGNDAFTYAANDGLADSEPVSVTLGVYGFLHVTGLNPAANSVTLSSNSIQIYFNGDLDPASVDGKFMVHGSLSGIHAWNASVETNEVTLALLQPLADGEKVDVSVLGGLKGIGYLQLATGFNYQFGIAAPRGSGNFTNGLVGTADAYHTKVAVGDLNGDGLPDAITVNGGIIGDNARVYLNQGNGTFLEQTMGTAGDFGRYQQVALADFDGNGSLDAFLVGSFVEFWRNDGAGNFSINRLPSPPYFIQFIAVGDFNQDGAMDVFACGTDSYTTITDSKGNKINPTVIWVWFNDGHGNFTQGPITRIAASLDTGAVGDINGDGAPDVWLSGFYGDQIFTNDSTGQFSSDGQSLGTGFGQSVVLGDLNGDGLLDAMVDYYPDGVRTWFNHGSGKFVVDPQPLLQTNNVSQLALGDIMGNGRLDLAVACRFASSSSTNVLSLILTNDGTGHFGVASLSPSSADCTGVALADFDGNGSLDAFFAVGGLNPATNQIWLNHRMPVANDDAYVSSTTSVGAPGVLANDLPGDGAQFNAVLDSQPLHGSVTLSANGGFTYTPGGGFTGADVFTYHVDDGIQNSRIARVKIGNTAPIANADSGYFALNDLPLDIAPAAGVLANDTDAEGDPLIALLNQVPTHGTVQLNANGSFLYTATAGYTGPDSFTYRATDGYATSGVASVTITVGARLTVSQKSPAAGALTAPRDAGVVVQFNHALDPVSVLGQVAISGSLSGPHASVVGAVSNVLSITPAVPFSPGEMVSVTLASGLRGQLGERMASPVVWQFTVAAPFGVGQLTDSGQQLSAFNATNAAAVALADVDGDGSLDAIVAQGGDLNSNAFFAGSTAIMIWKNNGHGVFSDTGQRLGTNTTTAAFQVLALDANGDSAPDFVVMRNLTTGELWTNNGTGTFSLSPQSFLLGDQTVTNNSAVVAGDFNGDGSPDLAILHVMSQYPNPTVLAIGIWTNDGHGVFTDSGQRLKNAGDNGPRTLLAGDVFGHGVLDLVEINGSSGARIWENDGTGRFTDTGMTFGPGFFIGAAMGDLNGDGIPDVAGIGISNVTVWLNDGHGNFSGTGQLIGNGNGTPMSANLADMNGDGTLDLALLQWQSKPPYSTNLNNSKIYYNDGTGNFTDRGTAVGTPTVQARVSGIGDLNGDGSPDLFLLSIKQPRTVWFNSAGLGPLVVSGSPTINDTSTVTPFSSVTLQTPPGDTVSVVVQIDDLAKGAFTSASLAATGFTGPVGTTYSHAADTVPDAQAALRQLIFAPVPNRQPVGQGETTTFTVIVTDGPNSRTNTVEVTSISVNDPPVANDDSGAAFTTTEAAAFTTASVLTNDTDVDPGDSSNLMVSNFDTAGSVGLVTNLGNGTFHYDPDGAFTWLPQGASTNDSFTYVVADPNGGSATSKVTITITGLNNAPVAKDDSITVSEHAGVTPISAQLLLNDFDPDAGETATLSISAVNTSGTHGAVTLSGGAVSYSPNNGFGNLPLGSNAVDHFTYTIKDVHGLTATANVNVTVVGENDSPIANDVSLSMPANNVATNLTALMLASDSDPDPGETATLSILSIDASTARGDAGFTNGSVVYQPGPQFLSLPAGSNQVDTFSYVIQDVHGATAKANVTITNVGVNDSPVAGPDTVSVLVGQTTNVTSLMLSNDFDPDIGETASLMISSVFTNGTTGTVSFTNGIVNYTPAPVALAVGQTTNDAFTYLIRDVHGATATGAVAVVVFSTNHPPVAGPSAIIVSALSGPIDVTTSLLANASDPDPGDTATLGIAGVFTGGTIGSVSVSNGVVLYDPNHQFGFLKPGQTSGDAFMYSVSDQFGATTTGNANVLVVAPPMISTADLTNGSFHLHILGVAGATCTVLASSDLINWSAIGTAIETSPGVFDYDDPTSGHPRRFYRVEFSNIPFTISTPAPPRITGVSMQSNGQLQLTFSALTGNYTILGSTNLVQWQPVGSATQLTPGIYQFLDTNAVAFPRRFYSVLSQ
ncbi:MAG TPA: Ig-like domain-containing protein [Candidatus Angelobacter sp.]|nr:Ig-like domain-containing protein [Candidatus Angelobacter sp.]